MKNYFSSFILDVDGVITTGRFFYSNQGKQFKEFGPDDHDALKLISRFIHIEFISADKSGFEISKKRIVDDMGFKLTHVSTLSRLKWLSEKFNINELIYMGDSFKDIEIFKKVGYAISPQNADLSCKKYAHYVTQTSGGNRAVSEACFHILDKFFNKKIKDLI